jgi:hypothetical protein
VQYFKKLLSFSVKQRKKKPSNRMAWSADEKAALMRQFETAIALGKVPNRRRAEAAKAAEPVLASRPWAQIKFAVYNKIQKMKP